MRPKAVVALVATAARSLFGRPLAIGKSRGRALAMEDGTPAFVTIASFAAVAGSSDADKRANTTRSSPIFGEMW